MKNENIAEEMKGRFDERTDTKARAIGIAGLAIGIVLLVFAFADAAKGGAMFYIGILAGLALGLWGGVKAAFGSTEVYDSQTGSSVKTKSVYFPATCKGDLMSALENEKWDVMSKSSSSSSLPLCLKVWYTKDGGYASAQLTEFVPYQYVPVGKLKEISESTRKAFIDSVK